MMQQLTQEIEHDDTRSYRHQGGSPITNSPPVSWAQFSIASENSLLQNLSRSPTAGAISPGSNHLPGLTTRLPLMSNPVKISPIGREQGRVNHADHVFRNGNSLYGLSIKPPQSFPENDNGMISSSPRSVSSFGPSISNTSGIGTMTGPEFLWGSPTTHSENSLSSSAWQSPPMAHSFTANGHGLGQGKGMSYSGRSPVPLVASSQHYHNVGSAPSGIPFERQYGYFPESPDTTLMNPVSFGGVGSSRNDGSLSINMGVRAPINPALAFSRNISENGLPNFRMMTPQRIRPPFYGNPPYSGLGSIGFESPVDRSRARRADINGSLLDSKKQYQLDLEKIASGEDTRTTLMIKNIPNKYTSKMLLAAIDESHKGTYDFIYLPIDFKNKCNVGYAFINMTSHSHIVSFYEAFNGKKWEKFNSEKVASLAYARIQGRAALIAHFENSTLMNEDKRCRPILFDSQGPDTVDQDTFLSNGAEHDKTVMGTSPEGPIENNLSS
ncbi:protein MEI2-like 2 isoform X4 [Iris pallida]|uniref:Protein MEI2-like 2 isoform X4 n=1 Tax=Iris pallida TaxID=29817 RepID=A0AAX6DNT7_IRIPA|nr:protein MEI2-like 2 isoform X4 [Iris pallida]